MTHASQRVVVVTGASAKHAIKGFTISLRTELLHDGSNVRVSMVQMPAINTPQFDWSTNRMPGRPQPVGPIFQPEMCARAVGARSSGSG